MRTYEKTHPWITFQIDWSQATSLFWYLLGQAVAKILQIDATILPPAIAADLRRVSLVKGAAATTAIEGNTLTLEDVRKLLESEGKFQKQPSKHYLEQEVQNVLELYNEILKSILQGDSSHLSVKTILFYNDRLLNKLPRKDTSPPGDFRSHNVRISGTSYEGAPMEDLPYLTNRLCEWLNQSSDTWKLFGAYSSNIVRALLAHLYIAWIHPFADGNGRTARALEFQILLAAGVPDVAAHLLSNYYNETRATYYEQLAQSSQKSIIFPFMEYAIQGFVESLNETLLEIANVQAHIHWEHFVYDQFSGKQRPPDRRRRQIVLDLSRHVKPGDFLPIAEISQLTPQLASAYAGKSRKTIRRDINALKKMGLPLDVGLPGLEHTTPTGLVEETSKGIRARIELISAFLPRTRQP